MLKHTDTYIGTTDIYTDVETHIPNVEIKASESQNQRGRSHAYLATWQHGFDVAASLLGVDKASASRLAG